jgi:hypothetical protein
MHRPDNSIFFNVVIKSNRTQRAPRKNPLMRLPASFQLLPIYELARHLMPFAMQRGVSRRRLQNNCGVKSRRNCYKDHIRSRPCKPLNGRKVLHCTLAAHFKAL